MDPAQAMELASSSRTVAVNSAVARGDSDIQQFYKNSVVFLTGGSGFLGKQLTEKLLRSCSISKIYLLLRPKKGKQIEERLKDFLQEPVFDALRAIQPEFSRKIVPVPGDVADLRLGISNNDWTTLTEEVNVIFHMAATIRFDETLQTATRINVRGTREALALGKACKNLRSYIHVSTAYTHATTKTIDKDVPEEFIKSPISPDALILMAESVDEQRLIGLTPELIKDWANTYTFTKAVAEELIRKNSGGLPIIIVRPGIVICSYSEPAPGWIDMSCVYGATGLLLGFGMGLIHTVKAKSKAKIGLIPCDMVNNAIIAAGREAASSQARGGSYTKIYTVTTTNRKPIAWNQIQSNAEILTSTISIPSAVYKCFNYSTENQCVYILLFVLIHLIPAYFADALCLPLRKQPRFVKFIKKLYKMSAAFSYFVNNNWNFMDSNLEILYNNLSEDDKIIFNFDVASMDVIEFVNVWYLGMRKYVIKDGLRDSALGVKKQNIFRIVHYFVMCLYAYGVYKLIGFIYFIVVFLLTNLVNV